MKTNAKAPSCESGLDQHCRSTDEERSHEFLDDALDESGEGDLLAVLRIVEVLGENSGDLRVGIGLENVSSLFENKSKFFVCSVTSQSAVQCRATERQTVGDDTVVDDGEFLERIRNVRVTVESRGSSVSSPSAQTSQHGSSTHD